MRPVERALLGAAGATLILQMIGALTPSPLNWGFHFWGFLPAPVWIGLGGLAALTFLPPIRRAAAAGLAPFARALEGSSARVAALAVLAVALAAFWLGRQRVFLLSDGQLLMRSFELGFVNLAADGLSAKLQFLAYRTLHDSLQIASQSASFRLVSTLSGAVWLGALFAVVGRLTRAGWERLWLGGLVLLAGVTKLFYGYVETSPLFCAGAALYLWSAVRVVQDRRGIVPATLALAAAAALHVTGALLIPSYFFLLYRWAGDDRGRRPAAWGLALLPPAAVVFFALLRPGGWPAFAAAYAPYFAQFIPLTGPLHAKQPYTLFSAARAIDFFNEQFLIGPFALLALPVVWAAGGRSAWRGRREVPLLLWVLGPFLLLSVVFLRYVGGARDWDLLASLAVPALLLVGLAACDPARRSETVAGGGAPQPSSEVEGSRLSSLIVPVHAAALFHLAGWVAVDAIPDASLRRFDTLCRDDAPISRFARSYALEELAHYRLDEGRIDDAVPLFDRAARVDPANSKAIGSLGAIYMDRGEVGKAVPLLRRAALLSPEVAMVHYNLAAGLLRAGELDSAAASFERAIQLNPRFMQAYVNLGRTLMTQKRYTAAEFVWRRGLEQFPQEASFYTNIGANLELQGKPAEAQEAYREVLKLSPDDPNALFNLSRLLMSDSKAEEARALLERLLKVEPENGEALVNLGLVYEALKQPEEAMQRYSHALGANPRLPPAYLNLARLMAARGDDQGALQVFEALLENDPEDARTLGVDKIIEQARRNAAADTAAGSGAAADTSAAPPEAP